MNPYSISAVVDKFDIAICSNHSFVCIFIHNRPEKKTMSFDKKSLDDLATKYTEAWNSKVPGNVAACHFSGSCITINRGEPSVGHDELTAMAAGFHSDVPDLVLQKTGFGLQEITCCSCGHLRATMLRQEILLVSVVGKSGNLMTISKSPLLWVGMMQKANSDQLNSQLVAAIGRLLGNGDNQLTAVIEV